MFHNGAYDKVRRHFITYVASVGNQQDSVEMHYEDENIWLTQRMMATLYDVGLPTINEHIKKIFADSELEETATIRNFRIVQTEGARQVTRDTKHYSLQMIIAVGFKVDSERAVQFRKWVNQIAKEYTIKGWVMDDEAAKLYGYGIPGFCGKHDITAHSAYDAGLGKKTQ